MRTIHHILFFCLISLSLSLSAQDKAFRFMQASPGSLLPEVAANPINLTDIIRQVEYPAQAYQAGIEGLVQVMVRVDRNGNYMEHEIVNSPHELLSRAVSPYLGCLKFEPAQVGSMAVESWKALPFRFKIRPGMKRKPLLGNPSSICPKDSIFDFQPIVKTP